MIRLNFPISLLEGLDNFRCYERTSPNTSPVVRVKAAPEFVFSLSGNFDRTDTGCRNECRGNH